MDQTHIDTFVRDGIVVVEDVFSEEEINGFRQRFHNQLGTMGIDHEKVLSGEQVLEDGPRIKGSTSNIFYAKWKMDIHLNEKVKNVVEPLMVSTFGKQIEGFKHPYGNFDKVYGYIDRVCYRLPDHIRQEGGLGLHLDRNPTDPYLLKSGTKTKWRPIQVLIALTDHYDGQSGGLKVVRGFHKEIDDYFKNQNIESDGGEFFRLNPNVHSKLGSRCEFVYAPKGSVVCWDNRLVHSTCNKLISNDSREVVYAAYMPDTEMNRKYLEQQKQNMEKNIQPPAYLKDKNSKCDKDWSLDDLDDTAKGLLGY